jgi:hypothetical protein
MTPFLPLPVASRPHTLLSGLCVKPDEAFLNTKRCVVKEASSTQSRSLNLQRSSRCSPFDVTTLMQQFSIPTLLCLHTRLVSVSMLHPELAQ